MDKSLSERTIELTFASAFPAPVSAAFRGGEPVRITHVGNANGMSPVYLIVDAEGKSAWVQQRDLIITDENFLPLEHGSSGSGSLSSGSLGQGGKSSRSAQAVG